MGEQAAYGRSALAATSFFTYVGLGLGFLATTLSLPFGIFVLVCQREPVRYIQVRGHVPNKAVLLCRKALRPSHSLPCCCRPVDCQMSCICLAASASAEGWCCVQDNVTSAGQARQISVGLAVLVAILILLPMAPETSDTINTLPPSMYL